MKSKRSLRVLCSAILTALASAFYFGSTALAAECNGVKTSIDYSCYTGTDGASAIALSIVSFLAIGVGITVVGGIVWGAIRYTSANGNASQAQEGIKTIVGSIIGLLVFIFMYSILNFLLPGGALLLPIVLKIIPDLIPSAFRDNELDE